MGEWAALPMPCLWRKDSLSFNVNRVPQEQSVYSVSWPADEKLWKTNGAAEIFGAVWCVIDVQSYKSPAAVNSSIMQCAWLRRIGLEENEWRSSPPLQSNHFFPLLLTLYQSKSNILITRALLDSFLCLSPNDLRLIPPYAWKKWQIQEKGSKQ